MRLRIIAVLVLLSWGSVFPKDLYFKHIHIGEDVSSSSAVSIYQDSKGRIWFGNDYLNVYDGELVRAFRISDYISDCVDNNIHMLCGDHINQLFFLADRRLVLFDFETESFTDPGVEARSLYFYENELFYTNNNCLYKFSSGKEDECLYALRDSSHVIRCMYPLDDGWLLGTTMGLFFIKEGYSEQLLSTANISDLFIDTSDRLWVGTLSDGLFVLSGNEWTNYHRTSSDCPLVGNQVRCINQDENGNIWVGTYSGITVIDSLLTHSYPLTHNASNPWSLKHSSVYAIFRDLQGGMWVGTYYGGLSYFNPDSERFHFFTVDPLDYSKLNGYIFGQMTEDKEGNVYIATENGGLNRISKDLSNVRRFDYGKNIIPSITTKSVWFDKENNCLYIGTFLNGLLVYYPANGSFRFIGRDVLVSSNQSIISDLIPWNNYLIVITQGGIFLLDRTTQRIVPFYQDPNEQQKTVGVIHTAYLDKDLRLWISSAYNNIRYISLKNRIIYSPEELNKCVGGKRINSISECIAGDLLFVISGSGLLRYKFEDEQFQFYNRETGSLYTNESFKSVYLENDVLLVTFSKGLTLLDLSTGKSEHILLENISPLSALSQNSGVHFSSDNRLFIGGIEGLITVRQDDLYIKDYSYDLMFNVLSVNNQLVAPKSGLVRIDKGISYLSDLRLPYDCNNLSLGFGSTNYRHLSKKMYAYKLEGRDNQWSNTFHNMLTYTSLHPGSYHLYVREQNGSKQISIPIYIKPPFYASVWAWLAYGLFILLFTVWLIRFYRSRSVLKAALVNEQLENQRIEEANRMKLEFYVGISHELRTPLTLMMSQLDLILKEDTKTLKNKLVKLQGYTSQMKQLVTEVLDLRKLEQNRVPLKVCKQDLIGFIREVYMSFQDYAVMKHIKFSMVHAEEQILVYFDVNQMRKAINNLLFNAFKFTPEGGNISLRINRKVDYVDIVITDTGCGIASEDKELIFDLFYQSQRNVSNPMPGTGIGLALTREIVSQHKGKISVESEIGKGSVFTISLLLSDGYSEDKPENKVIEIEKLKEYTLIDVDVPEAEDIIVSDSNRKRATVLIVEDNEELSLLLKDALFSMYNVYLAKDGEAGVVMAKQHNPDLIISDVMMPNLSGIEMHRVLKQKFETSHIPIIFLTAHAGQEKELEALRGGASDFLVKPFDMETLLLKCRNIIQNRYELQRHFISDAQVFSAGITTDKYDQQLLDDSICIIEANLENPNFNIEKWCHEIALGRTRLTEKIKRITGLTLNDFILQIKLRKCASLLKDKNLTISEIAWMSGFSSSSYMGKCFKEHFGMTPLQYRNKEDFM